MPCWTSPLQRDRQAAARHAAGRRLPAAARPRTRPWNLPTPMSTALVASRSGRRSCRRKRTMNDGLGPLPAVTSTSTSNPILIERLERVDYLLHVLQGGSEFDARLVEARAAPLAAAKADSIKNIGSGNPSMFSLSCRASRPSVPRACVVDGVDVDRDLPSRRVGNSRWITHSAPCAMPGPAE